MNKAPLKGMKDFLPEEMRVRDYVQGKILEIYRASGFERISTPILEDMENAAKSWKRRWRAAMQRRFATWACGTI